MLKLALLLVPELELDELLLASVVLLFAAAVNLPRLMALDITDAVLAACDSLDAIADGVMPSQRGSRAKAKHGVRAQKCKEALGILRVNRSEQAREPVRHRIVNCHCWLA